MKKRAFGAIAAVLISTTALLVLLCLLGRTSPAVSRPALAAPLQITPTVTLVEPSSAPNDLDMHIVIMGTDFISIPTVCLGNTSLSDVEWVTGTVLRATVPWGMDPGVYTLTVTNPDNESGNLTSAFTVTQGIGVWNAGELYGGAIRDIAINSDDPETLYAASENVGLFRSRDGGENWSFIYAPGVRDVAIDPITPTTIYWSPLHRSDDEGSTWVQLNVPGNVAYPHPTEPGTVYFSGGGGVWKSTDRGQTWVTKTNGLTDTQVEILAFHPTNPMTMALATGNGHVFRTTDGGESWTYASTPVNYPSSLAFNARKDNELWISDSCFTGGYATFKSTTVSYTEWMSMTLSPVVDIDFAPPGWGDTFSQTAYAAGCFNDAYKTTDGGGTWQDWDWGTDGGWGHDIVLHPDDAGVIYRASVRYGVYKTTDGGGSWQAVNQGLTAMATRRLATARGKPDVVYALVAGWEGMFRGTQGGETWQFLEVKGVDEWGGGMLVYPHVPTRIYMSGREQLVFRSDDEGQTWPISATIAAPPDVCWGSAMFEPSVLRADPIQTDTLLAGVEGICNDHTLDVGDVQRSTDGGLTWTTTLTSGQVISQVNDIAYDTLTETIVYVATDGGGMLRSADGGQNWARVGAGEPALDCVKHLVVEQEDDHRVFAQACDEGLYVSHNQGISWTEAIPWSHGGWVNDMLCTDNDPSVLYAATGDGLYRMAESGQWMWWERASGTLGYVPIYSLATVTATDRIILYAGTTGGYVENGGAQMLSLANNDGTLVKAGVHRYTMRRSWELYLPLVLKAYMP